jgi:catechol 2,3-dioxygenase-like lactoylglutathione lyase family enzyme
MKFQEVAIFTDKVDATADFYQRLLDAKPMVREQGFALFQVGDMQVIIHTLYEPEPQWPPCESHTGFVVSNLDETIAELSQRGITLEVPPRKYDWGRSAYLRDPAGHLIELHDASLPSGP